MRIYHFLRPIYTRLFPYKRKPIKNVNEIHDFWKNPIDGVNGPENYLETPQNILRSEYLIRLVEKFGRKDDNIIEIGCNVGRNLHYLLNNAYTSLTGIEINAKAVDLMKVRYPALFSKATIHNMPIEEMISNFNDMEFDLSYTMAVLVHIHDDSEWIFKEMARMTKRVIITIEDEKTYGWRHFPRNYKSIFEKYGFIEKQHEASGPCIGENYTTRVFERI